METTNELTTEPFDATLTLTGTPACVEAQNGAWCELHPDDDVGDNDAGDDFDEDDFDDDFDDDFEDEEDDGYGDDVDGPLDPFATEEDDDFEEDVAR